MGALDGLFQDRKSTCLTGQKELSLLIKFVQFHKANHVSLPFSFFFLCFLCHHHHHCQSLPPSCFLCFFLHILGVMETSEKETSGRAERVSKFKRICVFCGRKSGYKSAFGNAALELGKRMVEKKIDLVYGGGSLGLMGLISKTVYNGGGHVLGVIPKALMPHEISGETVGEVKVVADMHQRKSEMKNHADAFIALPGGYGTMEELMEMISWSKLGIHEKPVGLLNIEGYYNSLLALFDKGVEEGFIDDSARHIVVIAETAEELLIKMEEYEAVHEKVAPRQSWEMDHLL